jgi:hypothetical protein
MPKPVKPAGQTAGKSRRLTMHGSKHERRYFKATGYLRRNDEKPGFTRRSKRP